MQVCALLFCWTGVLGVGGGCHALSADCLARRRSDAVAAAHALSLKVSLQRLNGHCYQATGRLFTKRKCCSLHMLAHASVVPSVASIPIVDKFPASRWNKLAAVMRPRKYIVGVQGATCMQATHPCCGAQLPGHLQQY